MVVEEASVTDTGAMEADPPMPPRHGRDPPANVSNYDPTTAENSNGSYDMQGILNGDYDFIVNGLNHVKQAGYRARRARQWW